MMWHGTEGEGRNVRDAWSHRVELEWRKTRNGDRGGESQVTSKKGVNQENDQDRTKKSRNQESEGCGV